MKLKKYILIAIILSIVIILPVIYPTWKEARRLKKIQEIRKEATTEEGITKDYALDLIEKEKQSFAILFTGNTKGYLETCGCFVRQLGGVGRRATVIKSLKEKIPLLLVDSGGILDGDTPLDKLREKVYLKSMELMGYDAVCPKEDELDFLSENSSLSLVSANLSKKTVPNILKEVGNWRVDILGISKKEEGSLSDNLATLRKKLSSQRKEADIVLLLSNLMNTENRKIAQSLEGIDFIISNQDGENEIIGKTRILKSSPKGKKLGCLFLFDKKRVKEDQILLTEDIQDEPQIRSLLNNFYNTVAERKEFHLTKPNRKELLTEDNGYVGSKSCQSCHQEEYKSWSMTPHAMAFKTLLRKNRHFYPDCVVCHTTGFGLETGFKIGNEERENLAEVGCESCHGPGKKHLYNQTKENIRTKVEKKVCLQCHTQQHSPFFEQAASLLRKEVDHSQESLNFDQLIAQHTRGTMKPKLELFVMSFCPFGIMAEKKLLPKIKEYEDKIDFSLYFVAKEAEPDSEGYDKELPFSSLHGKAEVIEDIRQLVISKIYPEKFFDYLLCRADNIKESWTKCAKKSGIDVEKVSDLMMSQKAKKWFFYNIKRAKDLDIHASPTLLLNGRKIPLSGLLKRSSGAICQ